jgi:hypothetical protein
MNKINNPCFRCGKQRIDTKIKKERINGSLVTTTLYTCPDSECQKILDKQMEKERVAKERLVGLSKKPANMQGSKRKGIVLGKKANQT